MKKISCAMMLVMMLAAMSTQHAHAQTVDKGKRKQLKILPAIIEYPLSELPLFPNPASNLVEISPYKSAKQDDFILQVDDELGFNLIRKPWTGEKLDVSKFPTGVYIVTLRKDKLIYSQKLFVARE